MADSDPDESADPTVVANCCAPNPGAGGDPHFKLWSGDYFDYHGQCDLVLVNAPDFNEGQGLAIHIRTTTRYDYSFIESAAIRIGDTDVLEVSSYGEHALDGVDDAVLFQEHIAGFAIDHQVLNKKSQLITVDLGDNQKAIFKTFKDWVSISLESPKAKNFRSATGMMGDFATGEKIGRDGFTTFSDLELNDFGQEWQVQPNEPKLFQTMDRSPQSDAGQQCMLPGSGKSASAGRRLAGVENTVTQEEAEEACQHMTSVQAREMCVYDVMASGDLDVAQAGAF